MRANAGESTSSGSGGSITTLTASSVIESPWNGKRPVTSS